MSTAAWKKTALRLARERELSVGKFGEDRADSMRCLFLKAQHEIRIVRRRVSGLLMRQSQKRLVGCFRDLLQVLATRQEKPEKDGMPVETPKDDGSQFPIVGQAGAPSLPENGAV